VLFIDARKTGILVDRTRKEFSAEDIEKIAGAYHAWCGEPKAGAYTDVPGFSKAATLEEVRSHRHVLTPGRYVGAVDVEDDDMPFTERFVTLQAKLDEHFAEGESLTAMIRSKLAGLVEDA
jgi:type I restriction enzyme M protein